MESIKKQTVKGVSWNAFGKFTNIGVSFIIGLVLARLLTPTDYGILGVYSIFFAIAGTFIDSGFSSALIRKKDLTDVDCSTVFYFNIALGIFFYIVFFLTSPLIADFFGIPILKDIIKVTAINIVIGSFTAVQGTLYNKRVDFKTTSLVSVFCNITSGVVGIYMAYTGHGVWSLVYQGLVASILRSILLWYFSKWRPLLAFSKKSFKEMFSYGSKILAASLLTTLYFQGEKFAIGKFYSPRDLGLYTKGTHEVSLVSSNITGTLQSVTFPILAKIQDDDERLMDVYKKYIKFTSMVIFFLMFLLVVLAKPLILFLYTAKWAGAIIFLQIVCFAFMFDHITKINLNLYYVKGRSDIVLRLEVIKRIISFSILIASIPFGVLAICASRVVYAQIATFINVYYTGKLYHYGYFKQWKDFGKYFVMAAISVTPAFFLSNMDLPNIALLIIGAILSLIIYMSILFVTKDNIFQEYVWHELTVRVNKLKTK